jgi:hypothetical protein
MCQASKTLKTNVRSYCNTYAAKRKAEKEKALQHFLPQGLSVKETLINLFLLSQDAPVIMTPRGSRQIFHRRSL